MAENHEEDEHKKQVHEVSFRSDTEFFMYKEGFSDKEEADVSPELEIYTREQEVKLTPETLKAITVYDDLESFLKSEDYSTDLRKELQISNPDYLSVLSKWKEDLKKSDHGIVVAGETSSGKSTLINKILGKEIFKGNLRETTATICKIRSCNRIRIITEKCSGKKEVMDFTDECNIDTKEGVDMLQAYLKRRIDLTEISPDDKSNIQSVDIGFPVSFLKGSTILVDTPGIGGSGEVTHRLREYLPNALCFIFVIDVASAGGLQFDRLPEILEEINHQIFHTKMPCFHPENVMFVTNKWNIAELLTDQTELKKVWERLQLDLKKIWPPVKEENIFRINLNEVSEGSHNISRKSFEDFKRVLDSMSEKTENLRILEHLRFLKTVLRNISKGLYTRIELGRRSEAEQNILMKKHLRKINMLNNKCTQFKKEYLLKTKNEIEAIVKECEEFMSTETGKNGILNPWNRKPIDDVNWNGTDFEPEIKARVDLYVSSFLQSEHVLKRFNNIAEEINRFRQEIFEIISDMENEWTRMDHYVHENESHLYLTQIGVLTSPVWIAALAFGFGLPAAIFGGICFVATAFFRWVTKTKEDIDHEYNKCKKTVLKQMQTLLREKCGSKIDIMVKNVAEELLQRVSALEKILENTSKTRDQILKNQNQLLNLSMRLSNMEECVNNLLESLDSK